MEHRHSFINVDNNFFISFARLNNFVCCYYKYCGENFVAKINIEYDERFNETIGYFYCSNCHNKNPDFTILKSFLVIDKDNLFKFVKKLLILE
jgi:hypothetical protein